MWKLSHNFSIGSGSCLLKKLWTTNALKRDSFVSEIWECHIPAHFLVVTSKGSVYFSDCLETEQASLCASHQKLSEHPVGWLHGSNMIRMEPWRQDWRTHKLCLFTWITNMRRGAGTWKYERRCPTLTQTQDFGKEPTKNVHIFTKGTHNVVVNYVVVPWNRPS
jgi:hypothetical protein